MASAMHQLMRRRKSMRKKLCLLLLLFTLVGLLAACDEPVTLVPPASNENAPDRPAHTHAFGEWTVVSAATCTADGPSPSYLARNRTLGPPLENNPEPPPSSRLEVLQSFNLLCLYFITKGVGCQPLTRLTVFTDFLL